MTEVPAPEWNAIGETFEVDSPDPDSFEPEQWPEPCDWSWGNEDPNALEWWAL